MWCFALTNSSAFHYLCLRHFGSNDIYQLSTNFCSINLSGPSKPIWAADRDFQSAFNKDLRCLVASCFYLSTFFFSLWCPLVFEQLIPGYLLLVTSDFANVSGIPVSIMSFSRQRNQFLHPIFWTGLLKRLLAFEISNSFPCFLRRGDWNQRCSKCRWPMDLQWHL